MTRGKKNGSEPRLLPSSELASLFAALTRRDYDLIGPTVRDGAIVLDRLVSPEQLPMGWTDEQSPGHYCHWRNSRLISNGRCSRRWRWSSGHPSWIFRSSSRITNLWRCAIPMSIR